MSGFLIVPLIPGSPAVLAGIKPNDRLIAIDDKPINSIDDFVSTTAEWKSNRSYDLIRNNQMITISVPMNPRTEKVSNYGEIIKLISPKETTQIN